MGRDEHIGYQIKRISDALAARANCAVKNADLTFSQMRALKALMIKGGSATQKQLEREFGVSHPTMAGIVRRLADKGFVRAEVSGLDRRQRDVRVTDKGAEAVLRMREGIERGERRLTRNMTPAEREQLRGLLARVYDNLNVEDV